MESRRSRISLWHAAVLLGLCLASASPAEAALELVSRSSFGEQGRAASYQPTISAGGRHVAFVSDADNLVENDPNSWYFGVDPDVFVFDRETGTVENASAALNSEGFWFLRTVCRDPAIDAAGRFVAFECFSGYHTAHNMNGMRFDIYLHDRDSGVLTRITQGMGGRLTNDASYGAALSADGRHVAFSSRASNLHPQDADRLEDVYLYDRQSAVLELVSVTTGGEKGNGASSAPALSADGRFVAFVSSAVNLTGMDGGGLPAVLLRDRQAGTTTKIAATGVAGGSCGEPSISADGELLAFTVTAADGGASIFLADRESATARLEVSGSAPALSADGRFLAYVSAGGDVMLLDTGSGRSEPLSRSPLGDPGNAPSAAPAVSAHGASVVFASTASNLTAGDGNGAGDVFLHSAAADTTPPVLSLSALLGILWPPNKKYVPVTVDGLAEDDAELASVEITVSDEYGEMLGMLVPGFGSTVWLEAWREGDDRDGRVYTITAVATDAAGNRSEVSVPVVVPHDLREKKR